MHAEAELLLLQQEFEALVARGAVDRAKTNLAQLQKLCTTGCAEVTQLSAAIAKGPTSAPTATASATAPVTRIPDAPAPEEKN